MLVSYATEGREFHFSQRRRPSTDRNQFTVIVGKNGTGKSRLLRSIVIDVLRDITDLKGLQDLPAHARERPLGSLIASELPSRVICASTSPFDKFPVPGRRAAPNGYSYLGLKGLTTSNLGVAYISRIIYTLADAANSSMTQAGAIGDVLDYLEYESVINVSVSISARGFLERLVSSHAPRDTLREFVDRSTVFAPDYLSSLRLLSTADERTFRKVFKLACLLGKEPRREKIEMFLGADGTGMHGNVRSGLRPADLIMLGRYGLLKLNDVKLQKKQSDRPVMMSEMSSGEQSVVMALLGIASQLADGALICIDEPEVCLHPEWQERYIRLLSQVFSHHRGCHFLIATHSPQIVAQLPDIDCHVMQMEDGIAHPSSEFARRSIDYQLAVLFNAPGFKNEYLSRIALKIFVDVSRTKKFSNENRMGLADLLAVQSRLREDDPLKDIIDTLNRMFHQYGGH